MKNSNDESNPRPFGLQPVSQQSALPRGPCYPTVDVYALLTEFSESNVVINVTASKYVSNHAGNFPTLLPVSLLLPLNFHLVNPNCNHICTVK